MQQKSKGKEAKNLCKIKMHKSNFKKNRAMLVLIVIAIAIGVTMYNKTNKSNEPKIEAEKITGLILDDHKISFARDGIVNEGKLWEIQNMNYRDIKKSLNVKTDFCVYIQDGEGNLILAKGSPKLNGDDLYCKE